MRSFELFLCGAVRTLEYGTVAMREAGFKTPKDLMLAGVTMLEGDWDVTAQVIVAGLRKHHPEITLEQILEELDGSLFIEFSEALQTYLTAKRGVSRDAPLPNGATINSGGGSVSDAASPVPNTTT